MDKQHKYLSGILLNRCLIAGDPMVDDRLEAMLNLTAGVQDHDPFGATKWMWQLRDIEGADRQSLVFAACAAAFERAVERDTTQSVHLAQSFVRASAEGTASAQLAAGLLRSANLMAKKL